METVMLSEISKGQKSIYSRSHSFLEPRPKLIMVVIMMMMGHECESGVV
jgi:hypothetical protein